MSIARALSQKLSHGGLLQTFPTRTPLRLFARIACNTSSPSLSSSFSLKIRGVRFFSTPNSPTTVLEEERAPEKHFTLKARSLRFATEVGAVWLGMGSTFLAVLLTRPLIPQVEISALTWQSLVVGAGLGTYWLVSSYSLRLRHGYKFPAGKFGTYNPFLVLLAGLVAGTLTQVVLASYSDSDEDPLLRQLGITGMYFPHMVLMGPLVEELVFRWVLFGRILQSVGVVPAYLFNVPLFGIAHYSETSVKVLASGAAGLVFTLAYHATGRLWVPVLLHSISNGMACAYYYLLNPFVEQRETRMYYHFRAMFATDEIFHALRIRGGAQPPAELTSLFSRLFARLSSAEVMDCQSFGRLVHFLPDIQNEVADALVVLLEKADSDIHQQCIGYVNDVNHAIWTAVFGAKSTITTQEFAEFLFRMCSDEKNLLALKEVDMLTEPISFTYSIAPTKGISKF